MQHISISKPVHAVEAGHIYEHIFVDSLTQHLRSAGFFSYVDYEIDAKTMHAGMVVINMQLFNEDLEAVINGYIDAYSRDDISEDSINGALLQIMAEYGEDIAEIDDNRLRAQIDSIAETKWNMADTPLPEDWTFDVEAISFHTSPSHTFNEIHQRITLEKAKIDTSLEPLALIVCKAVRSNLIEDITAQTYSFTHHDSFTATDTTLVDSNVYIVDARQSTSIGDEPDITKAFFENARSHGFAKRLARTLSTAEVNSVAYPIVEELTEKLHRPIPITVWKDTATEEAVQHILDSLSVTFEMKSHK